MRKWLLLLLFSSVARAQNAAPASPQPADSAPSATAAPAPAGTTLVPISSPAPTWFLRAKDQPIATFIRNLAQAHGLSSAVDPGVTGNISGDFSGTPLDKMLTDLSATYDFVWYSDGRAVWVVPQSQVVTQVFTSERYEVSRLYDVLKQMGVLNPTIVVKVEPANNLLVLSGPPRLLELATSLSKSLDRSSTSTLAERPVIKVYPLTYAWAYDLKFGYGENGITVPGVATLLSQVMAGTSAAPGEDAMKSSSSQPQSLKPVSAETITPANSSGPASAAATAAVNKAAATEEQAAAAAPVSQLLTSITSDVRLNAVIIKDRQDRQAMYEELIKAFDKPVRMISITAVIVDLNAAARTNLGMNDIAVDNGSGSSGALRPSGAAATPAAAATAVTNIVLGSYQIRASLEAQQALGNARVVSQPAVLTFDNMSAVVSQDSSFYVQVPGTYNSSLYEVKTGLSLRVTPQILIEDGKPRIKLLVSVRDGAVQSQTTAVQGIPQTTENFINTQAVINEGQSLLIGGIFRSVQRSDTTGIPVLMHIPILGYLFKNETTENSQVERVYLITPRVIELNAANANADEFKKLLPPTEPDTVLTPKPIYGMPEYPPGPNPTPENANRGPVPAPFIFKR